MHRWAKHYIFGRTARVKVDGFHSKKVKLREGVTQGGVLSPTLFLEYINNIINTTPNQVSESVYADDLALWRASEYSSGACYRIQQTVNSIILWAEDKGINSQLNKDQRHSLLSLSISKEQINISIQGKTISKMTHLDLLVSH